MVSKVGQVGLTDTQLADALEKHRGIVVNAVKKCLPLTDPDFSDVVQSVFVQLIEKKLPRYDVTKARLPRYLLVAARSAAHSEVAKLALRRSRERAVGPFAPEPSGELIGMARIEAAAEAILTEPSRFLTPRQVEVLVEVRKRPAEPRTAMAKRLGYSDHSGLSNALRRIRERIEQVGMADIAERS